MTQTDDEAVRWLRENAIVLNSAEPGEPYSDLMPLKEIVGDARIVALGEAAHGGREFFAMKHRILRFLVEEMGFNMLVIEDGWAQTLPIKEYVVHGKGTAEEAFNRPGVIFLKTQEVFDLIEWMRAYNARRGSAPALSYHGIDMQEAGIPMEVISDYLQIVDPDAVEEARSRYSCLKDREQYHNLPEEERSKCRPQLQKIYDYLTSKQAAYEEKSSPEAFAQAQFSARIVLQAEEMFSSEFHIGWEVRDRCMAENLSWLMEQKGDEALAVVWAHNAHINTAGFEGPAGPLQSMGMHLRERYGDDLLTIGFNFYNGSVSAFGPVIDRPDVLPVHELPPAPKGSYGDYFHRANMPIFLLDLRHIEQDSPAGAYLWDPDPRAMWSIGSGYNPDVPGWSLQELSLPNAFDLIIHIDKITHTILRYPR
jgi:erythromycin esterase